MEAIQKTLAEAKKNEEEKAIKDAQAAMEVKMMQAKLEA